MNELTKTYDKSVHQTPDINISRYYQDYIVSAANWDHERCPRVLTSGAYSGGSAYRAIPYPWYIGGQPGWIMYGFTDLDFTHAKDMKVSLIIGDRKNSGFFADMGVTLVREQTDCFNIAFSWVHIPVKYKTAFSMGNYTIGSGNNTLQSSRSQEFQVSISEAWDKSQPKFEVLLNGFTLNMSKEWILSVEPKRDSSKLGVKFIANGDTKVDYASAQWITWDPKQLNAVSKTFTTGKLEKGTGHKEYFNFDGAFTSRPKLIYGVRGFNVNGMANFRLASGVEELTKDRAVVNVWTWGDTIISSLTVTCIAFPS